MSSNHDIHFLGGITFISFTIRFMVYSSFLREQMPAFTTVNSNKMIQEGIFLKESNVDLYSGRLVHSMPVILAFENLFKDHILKCVFFALLDVASGLLLYYGSRNYLKFKAQSDLETKKNNLCTFNELLDIVPKDFISIPKCVLYIYSFNPILIITSSNTNILCNLFYAITFFALNSKKTSLGSLALAFLFLDGIYSLLLLSPFLVSSKFNILRVLNIIARYAGFIALIILINYYIHGSWSFLQGTIGFSIQSKNLQPNVGLYWYFFTEMFDHFRFLFLISFQINATILYVVPLTLRLKKDPSILFIILFGIITVFKPYPGIPEFCIVFSLLPIFKTLKKYMVHDFIIFSFFMISFSLLPSLWYLWIHSGAANANFFFGATLAFCTGQIFLITDILFANIKREFSIYNGSKYFKTLLKIKLLLK